jgi:hypothetical protein
MTNRRKILLETTIQIHRLANDLAIKDAINRELADADVYTTSFVLREILRTIVADLAYVYASVTKLGGDGNGYLALERLLRLLARGESRFSIRAARREQYVIAAIVEHFPYTKISLTELVAFLDYVCQKWLRDFHRIRLPNGWIFRIVGEFFLTGLDERPSELQDWIRSSGSMPGAPRFPSGAAAFLEARKANVVLACDAMNSCDAYRRDDRLLRILDRLRNASGEYEFVERLKATTRGNWCLGDLLIALEAPGDVEIYTEDRHFEVLCGALQRNLYRGPRIKDLRGSGS